MLRYIYKRLLMMLLTILGVTLAVFIIMHMAPGDPAALALGDMATLSQIEELREELGLNKPVLVQYFIFLKNLLSGSLGKSIITQNSVFTEIILRVPATMLLATTSMCFAVIIGFPLGLWAATKHNTMTDTLVSAVALLGFSMPSFWLALLLMMFFSVYLGVLPPSGYGSVKHLILPSISLGLHIVAVIARITRSSVLEVVRQDYVRTARSKGLPEYVVFMQHVVRNALIPVTTVAGLYFGMLMGGVVITETIFHIPVSAVFWWMPYVARITPWCRVVFYFSVFA